MGPRARGDPHQEPSLLHDVAILLVKITIIVVILVCLFSFVYGLYRCSDISMKPSIRDGDLVMYYRLDRSYVAGDVVVFDDGGHPTCGRVVAVAGDTVDIVDGALVVNGGRQQESEIVSETTQYEGGVSLPLTVGEDQVFVLGDNRASAMDSRIIGCMDAGDTEGTAIAIMRRRGI